METFPGISAEPTKPSFVWQVSDRSDIERFALERDVDGSPTRVLAHLPDSTIQPYSPGQWLFDLDQQDLDEAGEAVRGWVDSLSLATLVTMARELSSNALRARRRAVSDPETALKVASDQLGRTVLVDIALGLTDATARGLALAWVPTWAGTPDQLAAAAVDAARPTSSSRIADVGAET